jgi:hypothetical protein
VFVDNWTDGNNGEGGGVGNRNAVGDDHGAQL